MFKKRASLRISNRKLMYSMLAFVLVGITTMTIAYATLSTTLKITGSAEFQEASWDFVVTKFPIPDSWEVPEELLAADNVISYGDAKFIKTPTITGTTISNLDVSLKNIGEGLEAYYQITNTGEIPARLDSIIPSEWTVNSPSNNQEDIELVYEYLDFDWMMGELIYENGTYVENGSGIYLDDILCPGATFGINIIIGYDEDAPRVPYSAIKVSNLSVDMNFVAVDQNLCDGDTPVTPNDANDPQ